jgi:hypothetical protein
VFTPEATPTSYKEYSMNLLHVRENNDEVRVEICGVLGDRLVEQLKTVWETSHSAMFWRRFVVDISNLRGYDHDGHQLLHELHRHGAVFAAPTARSLDFLEEISSGDSTRSTVTALRRSVERASSPSRSRHRAGIGSYEHARSR